jgi:hypothetical protein
VLYIDVKRFSADIESSEGTAFQVRSYGWSAGFRLSYACDFQELAIWDCSIPPRQDDDANLARVRYFRFTDYLANFDTLWEYLGREAILGGSLARLHPDDELPRGSLPLDADFEQKLSSWRRDLAASMVRNEQERDPLVLSAAPQRILDRIVFLRMCEELGLEEFGALNTMANHDDGFWPIFMEKHEHRYRRVYDGILFPHREEDDPTGVEGKLRSWWLKGRVFQDIVRALYFPSPYRFNVLPLQLLGGIYEKYLGKRLLVVGNKVDDEYKPEYQRTKGAVYTPPWVVRRVVRRTLAPLTEGVDPERILALRVLDPACGSASFLLGAYDHLERAILDWFAAHPRDHRRTQFLMERDDGPGLSASTVRRIIDGCLFGVDIDAEAVEVARMSLALRLLERCARDEAEEPKDLLAGIGKNIRHGNSLVEPDILGLGFDAGAVKRTMPFRWSDPKYGFGEIIHAGGFDAVVGNPPYIEVKRYKEWMPDMYRYLKEGGRYETATEGKTDISMPFMERAVKLLRPGGRLGFIIQNRFFKTEYGALARRWLRRNSLLESVDDFRDIQIFAGRTTYTAILVLQPGSRSCKYRSFADHAGAAADRPSGHATVKLDDLDDGVWSLDQPDLLDVHRELARRHGTIGQHQEMSISVGLQTLYGKLYQLQAVAVGPRTVRARNGEAAEAVFERKALRPLCRNRGFYPFRRDNADAWVIFPYEVTGDEFREIRWAEWKERFPKTAHYLEQNRATLREKVELEDGKDRWHLYTRPQNLVAQARPKVLFPSTIEDTLASADPAGEVYQDNVRINSLAVPGVDLLALAAVINSTTFSALARAKAGLSDSGWRQFNRQFADLVPFPLRRLKEQANAERLASLGARIQGLQGELVTTKGEGQQEAVRGGLTGLWEDLDAEVDRLYELTKAEQEVIARYPRLVSRVELPLRAAGVSEDDENTGDDS